LANEDRHLAPRATYPTRVTAIATLTPLLAETPDFAALSNSVRWEAIRETADRHGMSTLVASVARPHTIGVSRIWCDSVLASSWGHFNSAMKDLELIVDAMKASGIQLLALKGPLLATRYYEPAYLRRPSADLDFAVRDNDLERGCGVLTQMGYRAGGSLRAARAFSHHIVFTHSKTQRNVELHFRLSRHVIGPAVDEFIDRAIPYRLESGNEVSVLERSDELFHLAIHAVCGRFSPLFHLYELRQLSAIAPPRVLEMAVARAAQHHLAGAFTLLDIAFRACWGEVFVPPGIVVPRTWLHWRINENLFRAFEFLSDSRSKYQPQWRIYGRWLDLQTTDRPADASKEVRMLARFAAYQLYKSLIT
jgi:hypothetical protein